MAIPPLVVLEEMGLYRGGQHWIEAAVEQLKRRRDELAGAGDSSPAADVARRIGRTMPARSTAAGPIGAAAAQRWKTQINENAKAPAFWSAQPELCHNEVCGWGQHGDVTRQVVTAVALRHDGEHPQVGRRFDLVGELLREVVADVHRGPGRRRRRPGPAVRPDPVRRLRVAVDGGPGRGRPRSRWTC